MWQSTLEHILVPTECMTSDALTKTMDSSCLRYYLTSGVLKFWNADHSIEMKRLRPSDTEAEEDDLIARDEAIRTIMDDLSSRSSCRIPQ